MLKNKRRRGRNWVGKEVFSPPLLNITLGGALFKGIQVMLAGALLRHVKRLSVSKVHKA